MKFLFRGSWLHLDFCKPEDRGIKALAASPNFHSLAYLDLTGNSIGVEGIRELARSPHLGNLLRLELGQIGDEAAVPALLPGPYTLILRNPAHRFPWLTGESPSAIGVRVPDLPPGTARVVERAGLVVATSANDPGGPDPATLDEVPARIRSGAGAELDGGRVPGTPSTVVDLTGEEPRIVRAGAVPAQDVLRRLGSAVRSS